MNASNDKPVEKKKAEDLTTDDVVQLVVACDGLYWYSSNPGPEGICSQVSAKLAHTYVLDHPTTFTGKS